MKGLKFTLVDTSTWTAFDSPYCHACKSRTNYALEALGTNYAYPSCANFECQEAVKNKILADMANSKVPA